MEHLPWAVTHRLEGVRPGVWTGWPAIEAATGGNTRQPFTTRNAQLLAEFTAAHYEVLPDVGNRGPDRG